MSVAEQFTRPIWIRLSFWPCNQKSLVSHGNVEARDGCRDICFIMSYLQQTCIFGVFCSPSRQVFSNSFSEAKLVYALGPSVENCFRQVTACVTKEIVGILGVVSWTSMIVSLISELEFSYYLAIGVRIFGKQECKLSGYTLIGHLKIVDLKRLTTNLTRNLYEAIPAQNCTEALLVSMERHKTTIGCLEMTNHWTMAQPPSEWYLFGVTWPTSHACFVLSFARSVLHVAGNSESHESSLLVLVDIPFSQHASASHRNYPVLFLFSSSAQSPTTPKIIEID